MSAPEMLLDGRVHLFCGDSREVLRGIASDSIDSCVCDPPYALVSIVKRFGKAGAAPVTGNAAYARASAGFMGKAWDTGEVAFDAKFWREVLRVLKPGGHVVAFGGTRAFQRLACAIEDAGFEIRDAIGDLVSLDPGVRAFVESLSETQLDAFLRLADLMGFDGLLAWVYGTGFPKSTDFAAVPGSKGNGGREVRPELVGTPFAEGWGTALKPAWEPICLARKPLVGTVAENVLGYGTGAVNVHGCRIGEREARQLSRNASIGFGGSAPQGVVTDGGHGRWPANILHDGSAEVVAAFPDTASGTGAVKGTSGAGYRANAFGSESRPAGTPNIEYGDAGSASRFFYSAKADADDRLGSKHPTVKPVDLMQWLVRLVTPPGGTVLDPFAGTGTTGEAAWREGFSAVLIERDETYQNDIRRRMALAVAGPDERRFESVKARATADGRPADHGPLFATPEAAE